MTERKDLSAAEDLWNSGETLAAGKLVFESIAAPNRPGWAANVLELCLELIDEPPEEVIAVCDIARDPRRWSQAHMAFDSVRKLLLLAEAGSLKASEVLLGIFYVAENAAKVTYNACSPGDPFDEDAGWWLAANLKWISDRVPDGTFRERAWRCLRGHE
jgi:hypothetical protein